MAQHVKFGLNVDPNTGGLPSAERITAIADANGLDLVGVQDHPYNDGFTDTLALITWPLGMAATFIGPRSGRPLPGRRPPDGTAVPSFDLDTLGLGTGSIWSTVGLPGPMGSHRRTGYA